MGSVNALSVLMLSPCSLEAAVSVTNLVIGNDDILLVDCYLLTLLLMTSLNFIFLLVLISRQLVVIPNLRLVQMVVNLYRPFGALFYDACSGRTRP